jgi:hypothetical protein
MWVMWVYVEIELIREDMEGTALDINWLAT